MEQMVQERLNHTPRRALAIGCHCWAPPCRDGCCRCWGAPGTANPNRVATQRGALDLRPCDQVRRSAVQSAQLRPPWRMPSPWPAIRKASGPGFPALPERTRTGGVAVAHGLRMCVRMWPDAAKLPYPGTRCDSRCLDTCVERSRCGSRRIDECVKLPHECIRGAGSGSSP